MILPGIHTTRKAKSGTGTGTGTYLILPALVQINEENNIVSEGSETVQRGHLDRKREQVVDERVQEFVRHCFGGHVRDALEPVVDVQRGDHHQETVCVDGPD